MNIVSLVKVSKRHAEKGVLDAVTLGIDDRDRVGVIGVNGSGKSTLLRIVAGVLEPDSGDVVLADGLRVAYVAQEPALDADAAVLEAALSRPATFDPLTDRADVQREQRALALLGRIGAPAPDRRVGDLSGGQRKRVALAGALVDDSDLLILDEPTNHLDVDVVEWLEAELRSRPGALLLVTHDRYLLDRIATRIVEVEGGRLHTAHGSYEEYLQARAQRVEQAAAAERRRANAARVELAWLRRGAQARTTKARYRVERAEALLDARFDLPTESLAIELPSRRLGTKIVELHNAAKRFDGRTVLSGIDWKLKPGDRIGLVGPNGSGKSTLLRLIAGDLQPDSGKVVVGETVAIGRYGQDPRPLPAQQRVLDAVAEVVAETRLVTGKTATAGELLEQFGFPPLAQRGRVGELSGGERRRLELLLVLAEAPNVLLLDEPTNDLDLDTLDVLESYLDGWPGVLVVATHDRYFLDRVCHDLFALQPDGSIRHHPGGWTSWRAASPPARAAARDEAQAREDFQEQRRARRARKLTDAERRELTAAERRLGQLEQERDELTALLQTLGDDFEAARRAGERLTAVMAEIDATETRWLELSEIRERASS